MKYNNLLQVATYFSDKKVCVEHFEKMRWPSGKPCCPFCHSEKVYRTKAGFSCGEKECLKKFTVTVGTIFENSKVPLQKWFMAIYLIGSHKKGISSVQLSKDISVTQRTAWFMLHRLREMFKQDDTQMEGVLEIDETYHGGKVSNKHKSKRAAFNISTTGARLSTKHANKEPVLGIVERGGAIRLTHIPDLTHNTLLAVIRKNVAAGSIVYTDELHAYKHMQGVKHEYIHHASNQFVDGDCHTQTIEGSFGLLKNGIRGIQHSVSPKHLQRYLNEFSYKYSTRGLKDVERFDQLLGNTAGRLKWNDLVKPL